MNLSLRLENQTQNCPRKRVKSIGRSPTHLDCVTAGRCIAAECGNLGEKPLAGVASMGFDREVGARSGSAGLQSSGEAIGGLANEYVADAWGRICAGLDFTSTQLDCVVTRST